MDTNNNNPMDPGMGSTPPNTSGPIPALSVMDTPNPVSDVPVAPAMDAPVPDMGAPVPATDPIAPVETPSNESGIHDSGTGFDPALPSVDVNIDQYKTDMAAIEDESKTKWSELDERSKQMQSAPREEVLQDIASTTEALKSASEASVPPVADTTAPADSTTEQQ